MALLVTGILFVPVIAFIGVSELGELAIGAEGTATFMANATFHNTFAALGITPVVVIILVVAVIGLGFMVISIGRSGMAKP